MSFDEQYEALTGYPPLSWQKRLYVQWRNEDFRPVIDLPTGLGKTMVMAIWLIARANGEKLPTRLIYVVDRRTVVDQATDLAETLAKKSASEWPNVFGDHPLAISTLRGQMADNREWSKDPSHPAIIIGTVDLIGSALLFSGYRSSYKRRPLEAGLLGQDSMLILDEAHLSKPFEKLIGAIGKYQTDREGNPQGKPMRVIRMSATSGQNPEQTFKLKLENGNLASEDAEDETIRKRFAAQKHLAIKNSTKIVDDIATEAIEIETNHPGSRIVIFARSPKDVDAVQKALIKRNKSYENKISLLTGTMRGLERDELVDTQKPLGENDHERRVMQRFLNPNNDPSHGNCFLISTSAGEVGFDLNADHLIGDEAPLDSWIQRLGRVNRRGNGDATVVLIKNEKPADKTDFDKACNATSKLLADGMDVSPSALAEFKRKLTSDELELASSPKPTMEELTDILLDAWSMTSIIAPMPGRPEVGPWLRGIEEDQAQTTIAWRAELELFHDDPNPDVVLRNIFAKHPIRTHESLTINTRYVLEFLKQIPKLKNRTAGLSATRIAVRFPRGQIVLRTLEELSDNPGILYADSILILPATFGGLENGLLNAESIPVIRKPEESQPSSLDIADLAGYEQRKDARPRLRILIDRDSNGSWKPVAMPWGAPLPDDIGLDPIYDKSSKLFEALKDAGLRVRLVQPVTFNEEGNATRSLVMLAPVADTSKREDQTLIKHVKMVEDNAKQIAANLNLAEDDPIRIALLFAAKWHDEGKKASIWQRFANNPDPNKEPLGKMATTRDPKPLNGYRHEFGSLLRIHYPDRHKTSNCDLPADPIVRDLALHLIATHHGGSRPHFDTPIDREFLGEQCESIHTESICRFARLQRTYGWWHLAWLENLLRCADAQASADQEANDDVTDTTSIAAGGAE